MKRTIIFLAIMALLPIPLFAGDQAPTEREIMQAGNSPPPIV